MFPLSYILCPCFFEIYVHPCAPVLKAHTRASQTDSYFDRVTQKIYEHDIGSYFHMTSSWSDITIWFIYFAILCNEVLNNVTHIQQNLNDDSMVECLTLDQGLQIQASLEALPCVLELGTLSST